MNKSDLAKAVSDKTGLSRAQAGDAVDAAIEAVIASVRAMTAFSSPASAPSTPSTAKLAKSAIRALAKKNDVQARTQAAFRPAAALKDI